MPRTESYYKDLKRHKGYKHPLWGIMVFHHTHYSHLKNRYSINRVDGVYIPVWLHVPILHLLLGGGTRAGSQWFGKFPNPAQRLAHWLCRIHWGLVPLTLIYGVFKAYQLYQGVSNA